MKASIVFVLVLCVDSAWLEARYVLPVVTKCSSEVKAPSIMFRGLLRQRHIPETDQEKCFMGCLYKEIELTKDGILNFELAKTQVGFRYSDNPKLLKKAMDILESCRSITSEDECILGYKLRECLTKNAEDSFMKAPDALPFEIALTYESVFTPFAA